MDKDLLNLIAKCDKCGKSFMVDVEGDDKTCDACLLEEEDE